MKLAIWLLTIIAVASLIGTFIAQNEAPEFYIQRFGQYGYNALLKTGFLDLYHSRWFVLLLVLLAVNLIVCLINRFSLKMRAFGTLLSHASIVVILLGSLIGMLFGEKGYLKIGEGQEIHSFMSARKQINLNFSIRLDDFIYTENIDPDEALLIYPANGNFCALHATEEQKSKGLIAKIPAEVGSEQKIADTGYSVTIVRYVPDFVMDAATKEVVSRSAMPRNPAIEVALKDKDDAITTFWVFARFPDMHQEKEAAFQFVYRWAERRPKDFISKVTVLKNGKEVLRKDIRVNDPLHFEGYSLFQSSYDQQSLSWSGLQIVKDPGVPVVYLGFVMLILGLIIIFYVNPVLQRR